LQICEHLPRLARMADNWALVRSVGTSSSDHAAACHMLLTGRRDLPTGFSVAGPTPNDWPSIPALVTYASRRHNNLPPAIVLPEPLDAEIEEFARRWQAGQTHDPRQDLEV
jgi:hypothetical protein